MVTGEIGPFTWPAIMSIICGLLSNKQREIDLHSVLHNVCNKVENYSHYKFIIFQDIPECLKKSFTTLKAYIDLFRGHVESFELS
jgi:hypothetical protein